MLRVIRNVLIVIVVIGVVALLGRQFLVNGQERRAEQQESQVQDETTVQREALRVTVSATGSVSPNRQVALTFESSGVVEEVLVQAGDRVSAGDVIARLDTTDLDAQVEDAAVALDLQLAAYDALVAPPREVDVAVAEAALAAAQAALNAAYSNGTSGNQAEIAALQAELARNRLWQSQLQAGIAINTPGFSPDISGFIPDDVEVPQEVIDQVNEGLGGLFPSQPGATQDDFAAGLAAAEYGVQIADANAAAAASRGADPGSIGSANAAVVAARTQLDLLINGADDITLQRAEAGIAQAQLALDQAEAARARAELIAPFDGVIGQINLTEGEPPPQNNLPVVLVDQSQLFVELAIDETDVVNLEVGQPVEFQFDALPDMTITGEITRIALTPIRAGTLVTYPVRVTLDDTDAPIRIGMSATATIIIDEVADVLVLPNRFIRIDRATGDAFVTIVNANGRFEEVQVELGLRNEIQSQIESGIEEGQRVVLLRRSTFDPING